MKKLIAIIFILVFALPCFAKKRQSEEIITPLTRLEKRAFQTKTYPSAQREMLMKSVLNTLQDDGYIVYNVNPLLGFIYGVKDFDTSDKNIDVAKEFGFTQSRMTYNGVKVATIEVCVNLTDYGKDIRVRTNFKRKLLNEYGNAQFIDDVEDSTFYDNFYANVNRDLELQIKLNTPEVVVENKTETKAEPVKSKKCKSTKKKAEVQPQKQEKEVTLEIQTQQPKTDETELQTSQTLQTPDEEKNEKTEIIEKTVEQSEAQESEIVEQTESSEEDLTTEKPQKKHKKKQKENKE